MMKKVNFVIDDKNFNPCEVPWTTLDTILSWENIMKPEDQLKNNEVMKSVKRVYI